MREAHCLNEDDWLESLRVQAASFCPAYWQEFCPASDRQIIEAESKIQRHFSDDFRRFIFEIGSGRFPDIYGGCVYSPAEIVETCAGPIWMVYGTHKLMRPEEHRRFYATRGVFNPVEEKLHPTELNVDAISLFDLIQIGADGYGCYHQLHIGNAEPDFRYCKLTPWGTCENRLTSFREFITELVAEHAQGA